MIDFLTANWWLAILLYIGLFVSDHYLTVVAAKLHKRYAAQYYSVQNGYEMNPYFEKEVGELRWFTSKHLVSLLTITISLSAIRLLLPPAIFEFFMGACLFVLLDVVLSHIRNILYFRDIRRPGSLSGKIESSYWLSQRQICLRYLGQAILFGIVAMSTMRLFFWGSAVGFLVLSFRSFQLSTRKFSQTSNLAAQKVVEE